MATRARLLGAVFWQMIGVTVVCQPAWAIDDRGDTDSRRNRIAMLDTRGQTSFDYDAWFGNPHPSITPGIELQRGKKPKNKNLGKDGPKLPLDLLDDINGKKPNDPATSSNDAPPSADTPASSSSDSGKHLSPVIIGQILDIIGKQNSGELSDGEDDKSQNSTYKKDDGDKKNPDKKDKGDPKNKQLSLLPKPPTFSNPFSPSNFSLLPPGVLTISILDIPPAMGGAYQQSFGKRPPESRFSADRFGKRTISAPAGFLPPPIDSLDKRSDFQRDFQNKIKEIPNAEQIFIHLRTHILGQDDVLRDFAGFIYKNLVVREGNKLKLKEAKDRGELPKKSNAATANVRVASKKLGGSETGGMRQKIDGLYRKSCALILGPTGCGKTETVRVLSRFLDLPCVIVNCGQLTRSGYVGKNTSTILGDLKEAAAYNPEKAEGGIIFLDELDKIAANPTALRDVGGADVQKELLGLMEGGYNADYELNTDDIIFVASGAFQDLTKGLRDKNVKPDELASHGIMPELAGRLNNLFVYNQLQTTDLLKILDAKGSYFQQQMELLQDGFNVTIELEEGARQAIATETYTWGAGARPLNTMIDRIFSPFFCHIHKLGRIDIDASGKFVDVPLQELIKPKRKVKSSRPSVDFPPLPSSVQASDTSKDIIERPQTPIPPAAPSSSDTSLQNDRSESPASQNSGNVGTTDLDGQKDGDKTLLPPPPLPDEPASSSSSSSTDKTLAPTNEQDKSSGQNEGSVTGAPPSSSSSDPSKDGYIPLPTADKVETTSQGSSSSSEDEEEEIIRTGSYIKPHPSGFGYIIHLDETFVRARIAHEKSLINKQQLRQ